MPLALDFETFYDKKDKLSVTIQGLQTYVRDPRFDAYLVSVCDGTETWSGPRTRFNWDALEGQEMVSHNAGFETRVYDELVARNLAPRVNIKRWHCSANLTSYLCNRRDLASASEFLLNEQVDKSERGAADGKRWEDFVKLDGGEAICAYARKDALLCWRLWNKYGHLWPEMERRLSELTIWQGRRGVQIDTVKLDVFYSVVCKARLEAIQSMPWVEEGKKTLSTKAMAEEARRCNIPPPPVKSHDGEEAFDAWEAEFSKQYRWVKAISDYRKISKMCDLLETIKERLYTDGCFPFELLYFGAHTGRWAGGGGFNMQNIRKEPLYFTHDFILITDEAKLREIADFLAKQRVPINEKKLPDWVGWSIDMRALFMARPGHKMIVSDLSQIEPRCLAWFINDTEMLERMRRGLSPYQAHAEATMGWTRGDMKKLIEAGDIEAKWLYALAKARVLGLGYGCGWEKFIQVAYDMAGLDITKDDPEWFTPTYLDDDGQEYPVLEQDGTPKKLSGYGKTSKKIVTDFRAQNPLISGEDGIWRRLDNAFRDSAGEDFDLELPSGRTLRYLDVRWTKKLVEDEDNPGQLRARNVLTALMYDEKTHGVRRKQLYGGKLTENLIQAMARDVFAEQLIRLWDNNILPLFNVHDEAVTECSLDTKAKDVEALMSITPEWAPGLPVSAEAKEVPHYVK